MSRLLLYYGGELHIGNEFTPTYIGGRNRPLRIDENIDLTMLKQRIMRALRVDPVSNTVNLICRLRDNGGYCATHINDDEVCEFILAEGRINTIVVYVEVEQIYVQGEAGPSTQYHMPDATPYVRQDRGLMNIINTEYDFTGRLSMSGQPPSPQQEAPPRYSVNERSSSLRQSRRTFQQNETIDNDEDDAYRTMDSGSTNSTDSETEPAHEIHESTMNNNREENNGVEFIAQHAQKNIDGLESMEANNEFMETIQTTQQWDAEEEFDASAANVISSTEANIPTEIYEGQIFKNKEDVQTTVNGWSIVKNVQYMNVTSNRSRLSVICLQHDNPYRPCNWRLHAAKSKRLGGLWKISTCGPPHSCTNPVLASGHLNCTAKFICRHIMPILRHQLDMKPREIIARMESKFDIKVSYMKAWDARRKAIEAIFGSYENSYSSVLRFMEALRLSQPGTVYNISLVGSARFKSLFWSFGPSIYGWQECRPVLSLDGTFLLGKYRGTLLAAVGIDGNGGLFPLAFAIVEAENNDSWHWFLQNLHDLLGVVAERPNLCIISDKHAGLVRGCREIFPHAVHRHCLRHLRENFKKYLRRLAVPDIDGLTSQMYSAGSTEDLAYYNRMMDQIRTVKQEAYDWLIQRDVSKWTLLFDSGSRYSILTTNASECFNGVLKRARGLPIQGLILAIYYNLVSLFMKRSAEVEKWIETADSEFVPQVTTSLQRAEREARRCPQPVMINRNEFEVINTVSQTHKVQILTNEICTCSCMKPQLHHLPCVHVVTVAGYRRWDHKAFVSKYFSITAFKATYSGLFHVVPPKEVRPSYNEQQGIIPLIAPAFRRRLGRPRTNRFRNTMDERRSTSGRTCGLCKGVGHNRSTCPSNPSSSRR